ncbi:2-amino-3-carboxymuconate-6-semialdehyde decarboxylase like protein [Verticillium longisporum]|nr:2-amino-3-carboxymuconate-6-semialdehyde decarboxylase like protein [Verticillium longisporum]
MASTKPKVVDIHTHMYPPSYIDILTSRTAIPVVRTFPQAADPRLILLDAEQQALDAALQDPTAKPPGRPLTSHYASLDQKIHFMNTHSIDISVVSLANPWLDFIEPKEAAATARSVNDEFEAIGLDDPQLVPVLEAVAAAELTVFLHPHYGLPNDVWGPRASAEYGHVLPLALGFPMETTIAVARMYLAGVFDRVPALRMLLAHSGGTLPFLAGRIESCIVHDGQLVGEGKVGAARRTIWDVLREQVYLDAVIYSEVGLKAAIEASGGADRLMFGTDHPFFPPLGTDEQGTWESVTWNAEAVSKAVGKGSEEAGGIMGGNAIRLLRL